MSLIELEGVSRHYGELTPIHALREVHLKIEDGEWVSIVGPSGSGKTTLLNIIGLLDRPSGGKYMLAGRDVGDLGERRRAGVRSRDIGFVFQSFHLISHRTVTENVMMSDVYRGGDRRDRQERAIKALERARLAHRADYLPGRLSGGERQRAAIARAILGQPKLLLCDEPTGNLDTNTGAAILDLFEEMHDAGMTIVVITHDPDVADRSQRQVHIVDGYLTEAA
jgi:ABC-type lipoprotein export system ATPase subunit